MNLSQLLTTLIVVATSATGLAFADDLGFDPMGRASDGHPADSCAAEDDDAAAGEGAGAEGNSTNSTGSPSNTTTGAGSNSTADGNATGGSSNQTSTTGGSGAVDGNSTTNSTADEDEGDTDDDDSAAGGCEEDTTEEETEGNATAVPDNSTAQPTPVVEPAPAVECAEVHIEDSGDDLLGDDQDWTWLVSPNARHLLVQFDGSGGLGLGGSPEVTLVDGAGRVVASGDSGDGWGGLSVELFGPITPGLWRLSYESEGLLGGYWVTIDLSC